MTVTIEATIPAQPAAPVVEVDLAKMTAEAAESYELVRLVRSGHPDAFAQIYARFQPVVFKFAYARVGGNRPLAEDITQETFVRALRRITAFHWQGVSIAAWLVTIARNLVADHFKSGRYRFERLNEDPTEGQGENRESTFGLPEKEVLAYLSECELAAALLELKRSSEDQFDVLVFRFVSGFSVAETAGLMGKNEGAIKAVQYRAVRAMARILARQPGGAR